MHDGKLGHMVETWWSDLTVTKKSFCVLFKVMGWVMIIVLLRTNLHYLVANYLILQTNLSSNSRTVVASNRTRHCPNLGLATVTVYTSGKTSNGNLGLSGMIFKDFCNDTYFWEIISNPKKFLGAKWYLV